MTHLTWIDLKESSVSIEKLKAQYQVTRALGPQNVANELHDRMVEASARRDEIMIRLCNGVSAVVQLIYPGISDKYYR